ncbi:MAG: hypothetical protein LBS21_14835 [Clostridiales bacterium]|nr:hypothetical protein [Clostridiales bacterium]
MFGWRNNNSNMQTNNQMRGVGQRQTGFGWFAQNQQMRQGTIPQQNHLRQGMMPQQNQFRQGTMPQQNQLPPEGTDGVHYEPINADNLQEIANALSYAGNSGALPNIVPQRAGNYPPGEANIFNRGDAPTAEPDAAGFQQSPYISANPAAEGYSNSFDSHASLSKFIQNERNAGEFYLSLSNVAPRGYKQYFLDIARESKIRETELAKLYQNISGKNFSAESRAIVHAKNYAAGLERAIREETNAIKEISGYYELTDEITARKINSILYRKVSDLCYMTHIYSQEVKGIK